MREGERMSWLEERERQYEESQKKEKELMEELAGLRGKIEAKKEEESWWQRYISWIKEEPKERMEDPDAALRFCEGVKGDVAAERKRLVGDFARTLSKLERVKYLGCFVRWVRPRL